jgi:hypothetical protein
MTSPDSKESARDSQAFCLEVSGPGVQGKMSYSGCGAENYHRENFTY